MAERIKGLQIDLSLDSMNVSKGLAGVKREFRALNSSMKVSNNNFKYGDKSAQSYKDRMSELETAVNGGTERLGELDKEYKRVSETQGAGSKAAMDLANEYNREADALNMYQDQLRNVTREYKENFSMSGQLSKSFRSIGSGFKTAGSQITNFGSNLQTAGKSIDSFGSQLTSKITKPILGIGTALAGLSIASGFKRLVGIDTAKAKLEALGNSTKEVDEIMKNADKAIEGTSMKLDETATVAASANAAGVESGKELTRYLGLTADAASVAGVSMDDMGNILNKATTQGKAQNDILQQLSEKGLPVYQWLGEEANKAGDEVFQMASDGKVSTEMLLKAIENNIGGAAEIMGEKSFTSALSNISTYIGHIGAAFLDGGEKGKGFFSSVKPLMADFADYLLEIKPQAEAAGQQLGQAFNGMIEKAKEIKSWYDGLSEGQQELTKKIAIFGPIAAVALGPAISIFGKLTQGVGFLTTVFGGLIKGIGSVFTVFSGIAGAVTKAGGAFAFLSKIALKLLSPIKMLGSLFMFLTSPVGILVVAITGIGAALAASALKGKSFSDIFQGILAGIQGGIGFLIKAGQVIKNIISPNIDDNKTALNILKNMFGAETATAIFGGLMTIKNMITEAITSIVTFFKQQAAGIIKFWNENGAQIMQALSNLWSIIWPLIKGAFALIVGIVSSAWNAMKTIIDGGVKVIQGIIQVFAGVLTLDFSTMWSGIKNIFSGAIKMITGWIQLSFIRKIVSGIGNMAKSAGQFISNMWTSIKNFFSSGVKNSVNFVTNMGQSIVNKFRILRTGGHNLMQSMWTAIKNTFVNSIKAVWNGVKQFATNIGKRFGLIRSDGTSIFRGLWTSIKNIFTGGINLVKKFVQNFYNNTIGRFKDLRSQGKSIIGSLWTIIKDLFTGGIKKVLGWMKDFPGNMAEKVLKGKDAVGNAFKSIFKAAVGLVKKPVNAIIAGASWILEKFGADKLKSWEPDMNYAKGTKGKGHPGGSAMVNDGNGAEAVIPPKGSPFIPRGKNVIFPDMPKGTHVMNAKDTADAYGNGKPRYHYKFGTGLWDKAKELGGKAVSGAKSLAKTAADKVGDIWDYVSHPSKLVDKVIEHFVDFGGMSDLPLDYGKAFVGKAKDKMFGWVKNLFEENSGGDFDGEIQKGGKGNGVFKYLVDIANKVVKKFNMAGITSGYRPGDPNHHGKRQAIDVAYPSGMNGSKKYVDPANWAFNNFKDEVGYVIALNRIKDRTGDGGQGKTNSWKHWPYGGHMDHLHISGALGKGDISKDGGGAAGNWKSQIRKAAKQMKTSVSGSQVNQIAKMIQAESGGNQKVNQKIHDVNSTNGSGGAKGLLQYIQSTFNAFAAKGHKNIYSGYDQLLAFFNNSHWKRDIAPNGGWGPRGSRRFATGGLINSPGWYNLAEDGHGEYVIPRDPSRQSDAMKLLAIASNDIDNKKKGNKRPNQLRTPMNSGSSNNDGVISM
ncbi:MAG: tape measure protein, partial [Tetragenococcus koreensis]|nr:tape measure protein [Tetragenococcus koreensis]